MSRTFRCKTGFGRERNTLPICFPSPSPPSRQPTLGRLPSLLSFPLLWKRRPPWARQRCFGQASSRCLLKGLSGRESKRLAERRKKERNRIQELPVPSATAVIFPSEAHQVKLAKSIQISPVEHGDNWKRASTSSGSASCCRV